MPETSTDLIALRATRVAGALRVALGVSLGLHITLAVGVKMFWHGHDFAAASAERPITVEFSTEAAQPSSRVKPAPPRESVHEAPRDVARLDAPAEVTPLFSPKFTEASAGTTKPVPALAENRGVAAPPTIASGPTSLRMNGQTNQAPAAPREGSASGGKAGILAQPLYRKNPEPAYPIAARRRRQEGVTLLAVRVTATGRTAGVEVKQSSGFKLLDDAAALAVLSWEFEPARIGTEGIESEIEVPVRFRLKD